MILVLLMCTNNNIYYRSGSVIVDFNLLFAIESEANSDLKDLMQVFHRSVNNGMFGNYAVNKDSFALVPHAGK